MLLNRLSYPCRYSDMIQRFGRPVPELSMIVNRVVDFIFDNHGHRLLEWNNDVLTPQNLQIYANAIHEKGSPLENCFGFIDGTVRPISRPGQHQRVVYNGHKRVHSLKFQCVSLPNGIIANIFGPVGKSNVFKCFQGLANHVSAIFPLMFFMLLLQKAKNMMRVC